MTYLHEANGNAGIKAFGCGPACSCRTPTAVGPRRTGLSEYYFEDEDNARSDIRRPGRPVLGEAAATAGAVVRNFKVVVKSFIAPVGWAAGFAYCGGTADLRLRALAAATDVAYSENPLTDAMDKRYRLYSSRYFSVTCSGGRIVTVVPFPLVTDAGKECLPSTSVCLQPPSLIPSGVTAGPAGPSSYAFSWTAKGRPHLGAEPALQAVCPRTSVYIWHSITGRIECDASGPRLAITRLTGSRFPTHRAYVDGVVSGPTIAQGVLSNLWIPSSLSDPTLVR